MATKKIAADRVDELIEEWASKLPGVDLDIEEALQRI
jgi:hypothetical protein